MEFFWIYLKKLKNQMVKQPKKLGLAA